MSIFFPNLKLILLSFGCFRNYRSIVCGYNTNLVKKKEQIVNLKDLGPVADY
jgi:hypothetical protein